MSLRSRLAEIKYLAVSCLPPHRPVWPTSRLAGRVGQSTTNDKRPRVATSSVYMNRLSSDVGRTVLKNSFSNSANGLPPLNCLTNSSTPGECVGPGSTALIVTAVPAHDSANPRDTANWAVSSAPRNRCHTAGGRLGPAPEWPPPCSRGRRFRSSIRRALNYQKNDGRRQLLADLSAGKKPLA